MEWALLNQTRNGSWQYWNGTDVKVENVKEASPLATVDMDRHLFTTLVSLFWLIGMPGLLVFASVLWHLWTMFCDKIEATCSDNDQVADLNAINECANPQVAKILSPLPQDFNFFKHVCETKAAKGHVYTRGMIAQTV